MPEIGETLRDARMRAHIDVSEIEAQTKIRAKYLRALENEEWSLLPGPTFVKSFLRTYAQALGLDGKALVEEYRETYGDPSDQPPEPIVSSPQRQAGGGRASFGPSRVYVVGVAVVSLVIVLLIVGLLSGGGSSTTSTATAPTASTHRHRTGHGRRAAYAGAPAQASSTVSVGLQATGAVYICLIGEDGRKLIAGKTLEAGARTPTYRAKRFELTLGNNAVKLMIDGTPRIVPASPSAIGYSITKAGRRPLTPGHLPTCT
jgi:cytoskeleton protein RodZ